MRFLWGFLMFLGCHIAINVCLTFSRKYKKSNQGMDLYVAIGAGVCCGGAAIFALFYVDSISSILIGGIIGFCTGALHFYISKRNKGLRGGSRYKDLSDLYSLMAEAQKTADKLQRIVNNPNCSEDFSKKEIAVGLINLIDAQSKLTYFEFLYVQKVFQKFKTDNSQRLLNHKQYLDWCDEMIAHFDIIAPYYKYCGNESMEFLGSMADEDKKAFRDKAKRLLESGKLFAADNRSFSVEWTELNRKFKKEFYDDDTVQDELVLDENSDDEPDDDMSLAEQAEQKDDTFIGFMGMPMNEKIFAENQGIHPYFNASIKLGQLKPLDLSKIKDGKSQLSWDETCMTIFGNIFGGYGIKKNLRQAYDMTIGFFDWAKKEMPAPNKEDGKYVAWLKQWGDMNILMGTICAYQKEYVKASYYFMNGLKTEMVNINSPYCDFIRYTFNKLDGIPKEKATYKGCGFSKDNPMGSLNGRMLIANKAMEIIPEMEGLKGETIIAKGGRTGFFGHLVRKGSVLGNEEMVDIYETYIIDSDFNLMKAEIYFNGYFDTSIGGDIKLAKGFRVRQTSLIIDKYNFC